MNRVVLGSRGSRLALVQTQWVAEQLRNLAGVHVEIVTFTTTGDRILDVPLPQIGGKGLFTQELESALLEGRIDGAVHSLKDLPTLLPPGLIVGAVPKRANPLDALVARRQCRLLDLPKHARVGTSSLRRSVQLRQLRPDIEVVNLRGNVPTRLRKMEEMGLDAVILAAAGLERLGLADHITEILPVETMVPAPGQGALAVETRADHTALLTLLQCLEDPTTRTETDIERAFLQATGGGCQAPLGALARVEKGRVVLHALFAKDAEGSPRRLVKVGLENEGVDLAHAAAIELAGPMSETPNSVAVQRSAVKILLTRTGRTADLLQQRLEQEGAQVKRLPMIHVEPVEVANPPLSPSDCDWLVFTSANAVSYFAQALKRFGRSLRHYAQVPICAVGPATAGAVMDHGLNVTLIPPASGAGALADALHMLEPSLEGVHFLFPCGDQALPTLEERLSALGAIVERYVVYQTRFVTPPTETLKDLLVWRPDILIFFSPSAVKAWIQVVVPTAHPRFYQESVAVAIGPTTAEAAREAGFCRIDVAQRQDVEGILDVLSRHIRSIKSP